MAWLSFIELDKAVVCVIRLASFLWLWFQHVCPLMPSHNTILLEFLLPWTWGISSQLLQQITATAPYLGWGVSYIASNKKYKLIIFHLKVLLFHQYRLILPQIFLPCVLFIRTIPPLFFIMLIESSSASSSSKSQKWTSVVLSSYVQTVPHDFAITSNETWNLVLLLWIFDIICLIGCVRMMAF